MRLQCSNRDCSAELERSQCVLACPRCGDLLEIVIDPPKLRTPELKQLWQQRRCSRDPRDLSGVWRFREFLPPSPPEAVITLGEGNVPLLHGQQTARYTSVKNLSLKHLGWNPTGCFKDLGMTVAITEAKLRGASTVACASTGNTAASMAAYAARAGIAARVYLPKGGVSRAKMAQSIDYGAQIVEIEGNFDQALQLLLERVDDELYFMNSVNPFRVEGQKTAMFELMEQLDWQPPDYILLPGGNLGNTAAFGKAFEEMASVGLIGKVPRLVVVQAEGANAFVRTWRAGGEALHTVSQPQTSASAIRIGAPRSWKKAVRALRFTKGLALDVTDAEIAEAKAVIGRDGVGCEPASATTVAGLRKLAREGTIPPDSTVAAVLTGHALKDVEAILDRSSQAKRSSEPGTHYVVCAACGWELINADGSCNRCGQAALTTHSILRG